MDGASVIRCLSVDMFICSHYNIFNKTTGKDGCAPSDPGK